MLYKKNRVSKKEVDEIFKNGSFINTSNLTFKFILKNTENKPKISFIAPKSISKKAITRNKLRRIGYRALKNYINQFPVGLIGVFIFKKYQDNILDIENEIKSVFNKIN